jgi:hypothetical protein
VRTLIGLNDVIITVQPDSGPATWIALTAAVIGAAAAGFAFWQAWVLTQQTRQAVILAATSEQRQLDSGLNAVVAHFLDRPELHRHIFDPDDNEELDRDELVRVETLLDMYAAALDDALSTTGRHLGTMAHGDWRKYSWDMLRASWRLTGYVKEHPTYYVELHALTMERDDHPNDPNPPPRPAPRSRLKRLLFGVQRNGS